MIHEYNAAMSSVSLHELHENPAVLLDRIAAGESVIVSVGGSPVAELRPVPAAIRTPRPYGLCAGEFTVPDNFDAPLPDDILRGFEGR